MIALDKNRDEEPVNGQRPSVAAGVTARSVTIAVVLAILAGIWVRQSEIAALTTQVTESVPAIPGLTALFLMLAVNALLRASKLPVKPLNTPEVLTIFFFVCISSTVMGTGVTQYLFALLTAPFYILTNHTIGEHLPMWLVPHDREAIRWLYEGSPNGKVPWSLWIVPMSMWLGFFVAVWSALYCLCHLFFRVWSRDEKLSFPLVAVVTEIAENRQGDQSFFRNKVMWLGFSISAAYNLINIAHSFLPAAPHLPQLVFVHDYVALAPPWSALSDVNFQFRPELIGLGFLVQTDLSFSVWATFLLLRLTSVLGVAFNMPVAPGGSEPFPYAQEQGLGGYLLIAIALGIKSRGALWQGVKSAIARKDNEPRWPYVGLALGVTGSLGIMSAAGMSMWVAAIYLGVVLAVALVYARIRAEAGVPLNWLFPFGLQKDAILFTFGGSALSGSASTLPVLTAFSFMSRGYFPEVSGYQIEAMETGRRFGEAQRRLALTMLLALIMGVVVGWYFHLTAFSQVGALHKTGGMWGATMAEHDYGQTSTSVFRSPGRIDATISGAGLAALFTLLRARIVGFPLHPLGYVMACSYGDLLWGPFFIVWLAKSMIIRAGGLVLYRRAVPFFLGFALGHFAIAGVLWGIVGACFGDAVHGYQVWFG